MWLSASSEIYYFGKDSQWYLLKSKALWYEKPRELNNTELKVPLSLLYAFIHLLASSVFSWVVVDNAFVGVVTYPLLISVLLNCLRDRIEDQQREAVEIIGNASALSRLTCKIGVCWLLECSGTGGQTGMLWRLQVPDVQLD